MGSCFPTHDARWSGRPGWGTLGWSEVEVQRRMGGVAGVFAGRGGLCFPTLNAKDAFRMGHPRLSFAGEVRFRRKGESLLLSRILPVCL